MRAFNLTVVGSLIGVIVAFQNCSMVAPPTVQEISNNTGLSSQSMLQSKAFNVINQKCSGCHTSKMASGGIDYILKLDSLLYYRLVVPGEPQLSELYQVIQEGSMPPGAPLSNADVQAIYAWIQDGFNGGKTGVAPPADTGATLLPTFSSISSKILNVKCLGCHRDANAAKGVSFSTYASTLGPVKSGDFYADLSSGKMPQGGTRLSAAELSVIQAWITAGAPNN